MQRTNSETSELDVEEFRRLGVRLNECRLPVIRQAVARGGKLLADQQLASPSPQLERELSRLVTSAYRVLDPRNRNDFVQRILVGRLQTEGTLWSEQQNFRIGVAASVENPSNSDAGSDDDPFDFDLSSSSQTPFMVQTRASIANWTQSLDSQDLIEAGVRRRRLVNMRNSIQHPWMLLSLFGLLVVTLFGVSKIDFGPEEYLGPESYQAWNGETAATPTPADTSSTTDLLATTDTTPDQTSVADQASVTGPLHLDESEVADQPNDVTGTVATNVERAVSTERADAPDVNVVAESSRMPVESGGTTDVSAAPVAADPDPAAVARLASETTAKAASEIDPLDLAIDASLAALSSVPTATPSEISSSKPSESRASEPAAMTGTLEENSESDFLPDPFAIVTSGEDNFDFVDSLDILSQIDGMTDAVNEIGELNEDLPKRIAVPTLGQQAAAREKLKLRFPVLGTRMLPEAVDELIEQLQDALLDAANSDDAYVIQRTVAEHAWLVQDVAKVEALVHELTRTFELDNDQTLVQTYLASLAIVDLDETKRLLARNGFVLAERLLTSESLEQSSQVARSAAGLADAVGDEQLSTDAQRLTQAIELSTKMSATVVRPDAIPFASDLDLGVAGRYYCLMLRNWDQGLPWLAKVSDARIASLVKQELALTKTSSNAEWNALADRWKIAADRADGRSADSIRSHVIAIKRRIEADAEGLQRLELQREIRSLESELPFYIVKLGEWDNVKPVAVPESRNVVPGPALVDSATGMIGRVKIDGRPTHFRIVYMPGGLVTPEALTRYSAIYSLQDQVVEIEFSGQLQLSTPMEVRLNSSSAGRHRYGEVRVNGEIVSLDGDSEHVDLWLDSGSHQLQWRVRVTPLANEYFRVQDVLTRGELNLTHSKVMQ
ncbi:hypothetical protein RMSM_04942 [Rhodopirellula maiorica SM1]|uniref:Uncharacterized protein n=1 Tax=Rhodopirellula maiorica SM1 TaxID=1265738 RepID=M5RRW9_9BACT|nr:hypothetical protein [Rhodopirellula maiorica]EMI18127.1 hypothetical protein RMSM_04942 [Rhodopirellula maiorica SM1]